MAKDYDFSLQASPFLNHQPNLMIIKDLHLDLDSSLLPHIKPINGSSFLKFKIQPAQHSPSLLALEFSWFCFTYMTTKASNLTPALTPTSSLFFTKSQDCILGT